jgi:hypothetical protein
MPPGNVQNSQDVAFDMALIDSVSDAAIEAIAEYGGGQAKKPMGRLHSATSKRIRLQFRVVAATADNAFWQPGVPCPYQASTHALPFVVASVGRIDAFDELHVQFADRTRMVSEQTLPVNTGSIAV